MKVCPIAIAVGCPKCPAYKICPAKSLLGGHAPNKEEPAQEPDKKKAGKPAKK
jgi:hypothetical protein